MKKNIKFVALILCLTLISFCFAGCSKKQKNRYLDIKETASTNNWEFSVQKAFYKEKISLPYTSSIYMEYEVKDANSTYLCIVLNAKNISKQGIKASEFANVKLIIDKEYEYKTKVAVEDEESGLAPATFIDIEPLRNKNIYYLVEIPKEYIKQKKPLEFKISVDNDTYYYNYQ